MTGVALDQLAFVIGGEMPGAEGDSLVDPYVVADNRGLADHDAGTVIDEKARSDAGAGMDIDPSSGMRDFGNQASHQPGVQPMQDMSEPVMDNRCHAGIADQDLREIPGRGIADEGGAQIVDEKPTDGRQLGRKTAGQIDRVVTMESGQQLVADKQGSAMNLLAELVEGDAQRVADKIVDVFPIQIERPVVARKQRFGQPVEDIF